MTICSHPTTGGLALIAYWAEIRDSGAMISPHDSRGDKSINHLVGGIDVVSANVIPDFDKVRAGRFGCFIQFHERRRASRLFLRISAKTASPSISLPRRASSVPMAIALRSWASRNCFSSALFQNPQTFPQNFTLGLVVAGLEKVGNELVEYGSEIHVHTRTIPSLTIIVNS